MNFSFVLKTRIINFSPIHHQNYYQKTYIHINTNKNNHKFNYSRIPYRLFSSKDQSSSSSSSSHNPNNPNSSSTAGSYKDNQVSALKVELEDRLLKILPQLYAKPVDPRTEEQKLLDSEYEKTIKMLYGQQEKLFSNRLRIKMARRQEALLHLPHNILKSIYDNDVYDNPNIDLDSYIRNFGKSDNNNFPFDKYPHPLDWYGNEIIPKYGGVKVNIEDFDIKSLNDSSKAYKLEVEEEAKLAPKKKKNQKRKEFFKQQALLTKKTKQQL